jgi:3-hydroxybutyryl-CoA dehydratase
MVTTSGPNSGSAPESLVGRVATFSKTVSESDIYGFAGITGDFDPVHVDELEARRVGLPGRIAHGVLTLGYTSATSSIVMQGTGVAVVSAGYDRVRFLKPVLIGDTLSVRYEITEWIADRRRLMADIQVHNQRGDLVAVARHIHTVI